MSTALRLTYALMAGVLLAATILNFMSGYPVSACMALPFGLFFALEAING